MLLYRLQRGVITLWSIAVNKSWMLLQGIKYGKNFKSCGCVCFRNFGCITIGNHFTVNSLRIADPIGGDTKTILCTGKNGIILIHDNVSMSNSTLYANELIEIDEQTCIGGGVKIYDTDFHSSDPEKRLNGNIDIPQKAVYIGKRVFIGGHSIILKGVSIGDDSVIGAGSVVTKSIPSGEIWAGNPAKFIRKCR